MRLFAARKLREKDYLYAAITVGADKYLKPHAFYHKLGFLEAPTHIKQWEVPKEGRE